MYSLKTNWMPCGARQRRAVVTAPTPEKAMRAANYYNDVTKPAMGGVARIDRAVHMHKTYDATVRHEYDPE